MVGTLTVKDGLIRGGGFLLVLAALNLIAWQWGEPLARALIPLYKTSFTSFSTNYELQSLRLERQREPTFNIRVTTTGNRVLGGHPVPSGIAISSQTLQGHAWQPVIIALSLLMIWPLHRVWHRGVLLVIAIPVLLGVLALDVPLVLLGSLEDLVLVNFQPEALGQAFVVQAMQFLNGGGRLGLGIVAAALSLTLAVWLLRSLNISG